MKNAHNTKTTTFVILLTVLVIMCQILTTLSQKLSNSVTKASILHKNCHCSAYFGQKPTPDLQNSTTLTYQPTQTLQNSTIFAKAKHNCILYLVEDTQSTDLQNQLLLVPEGYFVRVLQEPDGTSTRVSYADRIGYVNSKTIKQVQITPDVPYVLPQELTTSADSGTQLRTLATTESQAVALIPPSSALIYIASLHGQKPIGGSTDEWYFVQYFPENDPTIYYEGYVYAERTTSAPTIVPNTQDDPVVDIAETLVMPAENTQTASGSVMTPWLKGIIIALLCLPIVLFALYVAFRLLRKRNANTEL